MGGLAAALGEQGGWSGASVLVVLGMRAVVLASSLVGGEEKGGAGACLPRISTLGEARSL